MVPFRKSKKFGPFRFTLSNRGLSTSAGAGPLRFGRGADGKVRRTIRVPGVGLYDTKVIDQPPERRGVEKVSSKPPIDKRVLVIAGSILGAVVLLILLGNCGGDRQQSVASTVTKTVTVTAQPPTVTVTATPSPAIVTVTEAAPPPPALFEPPDSDAAPPPAVLEPSAPPSVGVPPRPSSSVYYTTAAMRARPAQHPYTPVNQAIARVSTGMGMESHARVNVLSRHPWPGNCQTRTTAVSTNRRSPKIR